jgi:hypothetical protein
MDDGCTAMDMARNFMSEIVRSVSERNQQRKLSLLLRGRLMIDLDSGLHQYI